VERLESREVAEVKGRALWQQALSRHVEALIPRPADLELVWEGERYTIGERQIARALASATSGHSYHAARAIFSEHIHYLLTDAIAERNEDLLARMEEGFEDILGRIDAEFERSDNRAASNGTTGADVDGALTQEDLERLHDRIAVDSSVAATLHEWWPTHDTKVELRRLLGDEALLHRWAPELTDAEREMIVGEPQRWASSDIPLFDALDDLLGDTRPNGEQGEFLTDRAAAQRDWVYGHVVIDEAQELSEMQWQMVMRRCPSRSITAVGDIDQAEAPHRHTTWEEAVNAAFGARWTEARLTICYRTPLEVMALTGAVLQNAGSQNEPPRAVRASGIEPWERAVDDDDVAAEAAHIVKELSERWAGGMVGVIAPLERVPALRTALPDTPVLCATEAKGLEWDATLLIDAPGIIAEPRGWNGLYVALTRCTQELGQLLVTPEQVTS
jgi:DNA helicase IV